ncbi:MAG: hypothetical protein H0X34_18570 [Chthoniobacterales bacterium]|nr:hypothetical protein [Chthoniobacterales bacterium]
MSDLLSPNVNDLDDRPEVRTLFANLKVAMPELKALLENCSGHWAYEDCVYRFYHHSFKAYGLQSHTISIVDKLRSLSPGRELNPWFMEIIAPGTGKTFSSAHNEKWREVTQPILEAFFHARYFLEMAVKYGNALEYPPRSIRAAGLRCSICII